MYNPYTLAADTAQQNLQHPRPQHVNHASQTQYDGQYAQGQFKPRAQAQYLQHEQQKYQPGFQGYQPNFQQNQYPEQAQYQQGYQQQYYQGNPQSQAQFQQQSQQGAGYGDFFSDPAASMAAQFAKSSLGQSNSYLQQNFGSYIPIVGELKYYFKVSNSYVWRKLAIIIFPYRHKDWQRIQAVESGPAMAAGAGFAPASEDVNAPDLYIPLMAFVTYILLWALFLGLRGDFHPQVFGYLASQTLACSFLDILIFKVGLYLLNCSTQSSLWDIISFSGYKYVIITALLCWKQVFGHSWLIYYGFLLAAVGGFSLFLMRSLKFLILPIGVNESSATISNSQRRLRIQFLFIYSVPVQFLIVLFMSR